MNKKWVILIAAVLLTGLALIIFKFKGMGSLGMNTGVSGSAGAALAQARDLENKGELLAAKEAYQKLVNEFAGSSEMANWQKKIEELNIKLLFSPVILPNKSIAYKIRPGDSLAKIAREKNTTVELIKKSNGLSDDKIYPGKELKVWTAPFNILVDKSQNILMLKDNEEVFKTYTVATGTNNCTPVGTFKIIEKIPNPTWFSDGKAIPPESPDNVLGTRWLGFNIAGYGIHGTTEPQTLGSQVTQGCVRMANPEVEELYLIVPKGTEVTIVD